MKTLKHLLSKIARKFSKRKPVKSCENCKYCNRASYLQPCLHCMDYEFEAHVDWEPEDE